MPDMDCENREFLRLTRDMLIQGKQVRFRTCGGSMYPFIRSGDILKIAPIGAEEIKPGDVIFYRFGDERIAAHRVLKRSIRSGRIVFIVKGDSVPDSGQNVYSNDVLGRVITIERGDRSIVLDSGLNRFVSILYARVSPFSMWFYPAMRKIRTLNNR